MKLRWHITVICVAAGLWTVLGFCVAERISSEVSWYEYPFVFPVYVGLLFGNGEYGSALAADVSGLLECLVVGCLADVAVVRARRTLSKRSSVQRELAENQRGKDR